MKTIALCIPAYNASWCLPRLLDSAVNQEIPFDEILVYNDCSTDNTSEVARQYGAFVIEGDVNLGCSTGKNRLAEIAKSEWLHFHDADDELLPNFTKTAHDYLKNESPAGILLLNFEYVDFQTGENLGSLQYDRGLLLKDPIKFSIENKIVNFALINKNRFLKIGGFDLDPAVLYNEDRAFYTKAAINGLSFDYESTITCLNYRYSASMSSSNQIKCTQAAYHVFKKVANQVGNKYPLEIANQLWKNAGVAATYRDFSTADDFIKLSIFLTGNKKPIGQNTIFTILGSINPFFALRFREFMIRLFKPHLRKSL